MILRGFLYQLFFINQIEAYGESDDFFVVKGIFGDAWKDSGKLYLDALQLLN